MVIQMKNLKINIGKHQAVLSFKKISNKQFDTLRWKIIEQNFDDISELLARDINENKLSTLQIKGKD